MKASGSGSDAGAGGRGSRSVIPVCGLLMCFLKSVSWNLKAFRGGLGEELSQTRLVGAPVGAVGEFHARNQRQSRWQFHSESHAPPNFGPKPTQTHAQTPPNQPQPEPHEDSVLSSAPRIRRKEPWALDQTYGDGDRFPQAQAQARILDQKIQKSKSQSTQKKGIMMVKSPR